MKKRIRFHQVDHSTRALRNAVGLAVRFEFVPLLDPHRVIPLVHRFVEMVATHGLGITGGTAEGKAWYFLGLVPHRPTPSAQTRKEISDWLTAAPEITNVHVGPIGETFYEAFGPGNGS
ncbi:hypothetical protein GCM10028822_31700 [Hymenobacter terrigena]